MNPKWSIEQWHKRLPDILTEIYELTYSLEGALSGEHGIGHKRKKELLKFASSEYIEIIKAIKRSFDPNNILNPGKIFDI